eukprot:COSAG02_NODE_24273_length_693_cov_1.127946_1_plen_34_part_10
MPPYACTACHDAVGAAVVEPVVVSLSLSPSLSKP